MILEPLGYHYHSTGINVDTEFPMQPLLVEKLYEDITNVKVDGWMDCVKDHYVDLRSVDYYDNEVL